MLACGAESHEEHEPGQLKIYVGRGGVPSQATYSRSKRPAGCPLASASREWADGLDACKRVSRRRGHPASTRAEMQGSADPGRMGRYRTWRFRYSAITLLALNSDIGGADPLDGHSCEPPSMV